MFADLDWSDGPGTRRLGSIWRGVRVPPGCARALRALSAPWRAYACSGEDLAGRPPALVRSASGTDARPPRVRCASDTSSVNPSLCLRLDALLSSGGESAAAPSVSASRARRCARRSVAPRYDSRSQSEPLLMCAAAPMWWCLLCLAPSAARALSVGIDLGTSTSAVAYLKPDGTAALVPRRVDGKRLTPSVVIVDGAGRAALDQWRRHRGRSRSDGTARISAKIGRHGTSRS